MATGAEMKSLLEDYGVRPNENLGQHMLINEEIIGLMAGFVRQGVDVIEVGAGPGHVTAALARRASRVTALEIDDRYEPFLNQIQKACPNVDVHIGNVIDTGLEKFMRPDNYTQVVSNLPFHIIEPMVWLFVDRAIIDAVLMIGDNAADIILARENAGNFGRMSFIAQTFFGIERLYEISRESFYPQPRTNSTIIRMIPKEDREIASSTSNIIFAKLVRTALHNPMVQNVIKEAIMESSAISNRGTLDQRESSQRERATVRRQTRDLVRQWNNGKTIELDDERHGRVVTDQGRALQLIGEMELGDEVLKRSFMKLDNPALRKLVSGVRSVLR